MSIFDRFKSKSSVLKPLVKIKVKFTADENEAVCRTLDRYAAIANAHAPVGMRMFVPPKVRDAISAQGLTEHVEDLIRESRDCASHTERTTLLDKAVKAQMKAYAFHNLPIYLSQLARMYESAGDVKKCKEFSQLFLDEQDAFTPDEIDDIFLELIGSVNALEEEGCVVSSTLKYQLDRVLIVKRLQDSGLLRFSEGD